MACLKHDKANILLLSLCSASLGIDNEAEPSVFSVSAPGARRLCTVRSGCIVEDDAKRVSFAARHLAYTMP